MSSALERISADLQAMSDCELITLIRDKAGATDRANAIWLSLAVAERLGRALADRAGGGGK